MVSTSGHDPRQGERRRAERRKDERIPASTDRRVTQRRSGADRRREPRD
jgi:hypothetical protein